MCIRDRHIPAEDEARKAIRILNPISENLSIMRTLLTPSMLNVIVDNLKKGNAEGRLFEMAPVYLAKELPINEHQMCIRDSYGTIRAAVSTFDTFNHIPDLDTAIANAGFFMEKGGVFLFDMNTPYKHRKILGDNAFTFEEEDAACVDVYKRQGQGH